MPARGTGTAARVQVGALLVKIMPIDQPARDCHRTIENRGAEAEAAGRHDAPSDGDGAQVKNRGEDPAVDGFEAVLQGLPLVYCRILDLRLHGWSASKIARRLGTSRQTVYRALDLLRHRLKEASSPRQKIETPV